ncbi:carboxymuconolactone decarboxylase family protein [Rhodococcus sp. H36-A4]|uniref:carboxymuconolactone decarboxylase family protein n=1 Tax=Rhodococcus sp. H36-A4 TaxID=3004353 RepID=UPI0022AE8B42|nr:carboxymuconolactone decarboxylase family protein [Rhodococcus sp. H36-A4]MCZ4077410.1 carboxymuconolactone decarboxylase family protein [Rhodococcus sp. H36-A4]
MSAASNSDWTSMTAVDALQRHAPEVAARLADLIALNPPVAAEPLAALVRTVCAGAVSLPPLPHPYTGMPATTSLDAGAQIALEFAEQFSIDVSAIDGAARTALVDALGDRTGALVTAMYVADWAPRVRRALEQLFAPAADGWGAPAQWNESADDLMPLVDEFLASVARVRGLDPVTTELVRLREARQHNCRICKSVRIRSALAAGGDESMYSEVDSYEDSNLSGRHKAALALTDAMVWQPGFISEDVTDAVRKHFSPAEAVELVVDMMRNASAKMAVAKGTDEANVSEGVEIYEVNPDGSMDFGLTTPAPR